MSVSTSSQKKEEATRKANRYCASALIALSLALGALSVGVFLIYPTSAVGIASTFLGIVCMLLCILFFALYSRNLREAEKLQ
jgi:putative Mn2+ efflux pump MntP